MVMVRSSVTITFRTRTRDTATFSVPARSCSSDRVTTTASVPGAVDEAEPTPGGGVASTRPGLGSVTATPGRQCPLPQRPGGVGVRVRGGDNEGGGLP